MYLSNGDMDPVRACLNSEDFRKFTKEWIDTVYFLGARTIFWDEPHMPQKTVDGKTYYGFYSRTVGFHQMDVYIILDENGAIAKIDAKQFIFDEEYFMNFGGMDDAAYKQGFEGITSETWTGEQAIIATATMTSNAMKQSTTDAFESFATIKNGGAQ
jgi:hypothetical protein